jgi:hypothetical protein
MAERHKGFVKSLNDKYIKGDYGTETDHSERTIKHTGSPIELIRGSPGPLNVETSYSAFKEAFPLHSKED